MIELPFLKKRGGKKKRREFRGAGSPTLESRLRGRLEEARVDFMAARAELTALLQAFAGELGLHLKEYVVRNVLREIKKDPDRFQNMPEDEQAMFREELSVVLDTEAPAVVEQLKKNPEWYDEGRVFLDERSAAWKAVKALDAPVNRVMKKYSLGSVTTSGWTWLSEGINEIATVRYSIVKRNYAEKKKVLEYLEKRVEEETRINQVSRCMGELFAE
ncbi:MAG: hypothetical protein AB1742_12305 [bacterium]